MRYPTDAGVPVNDTLISNYFSGLVNKFFKILPMRENRQDVETLNSYLRSLQRELIGCNRFLLGIEDDAMTLTLLSVVEFLVKNPDADLKIVKKEVFRSISLCNKLSDKYTTGGDLS